MVPDPENEPNFYDITESYPLPSSGAANSGALVSLRHSQSHPSPSVGMPDQGRSVVRDLLQGRALSLSASAAVNSLPAPMLSPLSHQYDGIPHPVAASLPDALALASGVATSVQSRPPPPSLLSDTLWGRNAAPSLGIATSVGRIPLRMPTAAAAPVAPQPPAAHQSLSRSTLTDTILSLQLQQELQHRNNLQERALKLQSATGNGGIVGGVGVNLLELQQKIRLEQMAKNELLLDQHRRRLATTTAAATAPSLSSSADEECAAISEWLRLAKRR